MTVRVNGATIVTWSGDNFNQSAKLHGVMNYAPATAAHPFACYRFTADDGKPFDQVQLLTGARYRKLIITGGVAYLERPDGSLAFIGYTQCED